MSFDFDKSLLRRNLLLLANYPINRIEIKSSVDRELIFQIKEHVKQLCKAFRTAQVTHC